MSAKRTKLSDGLTCADLQQRWTDVQSWGQAMSSGGQLTTLTDHNLQQILSLPINVMVSPHCSHTCPLCGKKIREADQRLTTNTPDHPCPECLLLLELTSVNTVLSQMNSPNIQHHVWDGFSLNLVWCMLHGKRYVSYIANKCFLSAVKANAIQSEDLRPCLDRLLDSVGLVPGCAGHTPADHTWRGAGILQVVTQILTCTDADTAVCVDVIQKRWSQLEMAFLQFPEPQNPGLPVSHAGLFLFLSLWKKLVKVPQAAVWCIEAGRRACVAVLQVVCCEEMPAYVRLKAVSLLSTLVLCEGTEQRSDPTPGQSLGIADSIMDRLVAGQFDNLNGRVGAVGFGWGRSAQSDHNQGGDDQFRRKLCLLCLHAVVYRLTKLHSQDSSADVLEALIKLTSSGFNASPTASWVSALFSGQDDDWVSALLCVLDIHIYLRHRQQELADGFDVHQCFSQFLHTLAHDHTVLLDLLSAPETQFLLFLLRYLKLVQGNWHEFVRSHQGLSPQIPNSSSQKSRVPNRSEVVQTKISDRPSSKQEEKEPLQNEGDICWGDNPSSTLDVSANSSHAGDDPEGALLACSSLEQTMTTLIRLRFGLEHLSEAGLFPYSVKPLLTVLERCEELYEEEDDPG